MFKFATTIKDGCAFQIKTLRQRGYGMMEVSLAVIAGLGLMIGGIMLYSQVTKSLEVTDKSRQAISIASEVRSMYRTRADFDGVNKTDVEAASSLPENYFEHVDIAARAGDAEFVVTFSNLDKKVCSRLALTDLAHNPDATGGATSESQAIADSHGWADCSGNTLTVTYLR